VAAYAVKYFTRGGRINLSGLPAAFLGALGIKGIEQMSNRDLDDVIGKLKNDPDSLDDAQKALLLKRVWFYSSNSVLTLSNVSLSLKRKHVGMNGKIKTSSVYS